jgi:pimeloyl-ACP methyl ester carboxylesterase
MEKSKAVTDEKNMLITTAADGTNVRAEVEGEGPVILILHPGMNTVKNYARVSSLLARRYKVIRLYRRQYRLDLKSDPLVGSPCTVADEVEHVLTIVKAAGAPVLLFGHSSGGPVALEALVTSPSAFVGGMIYEPASVINGTEGLHLSGDRIERNGDAGEGLKRTRQALMSGKPGKAMSIFSQYIAGWPSFLGNLAGALTAEADAFVMDVLGKAAVVFKVPVLFCDGRKDFILIRHRFPWRDIFTLILRAVILRIGENFQREKDTHCFVCHFDFLRFI